MAQRKRSDLVTAKPKLGFVLGSAAFAKISAVEGIRLGEDAVRRSRDFDRRNLSAAERRREIIAAHRPKS